MNQPGQVPSRPDADGSTPEKEHPSVMPDAVAGLTTEPSVPDYELLRRIGHGAYGDVWLARSKATGALRAAKIVWRHTFEDERPFKREFEGIQRFERISREHPSQLALFHIGRNEPAGYFYYVMELADAAAPASNQCSVGQYSVGHSPSAKPVTVGQLNTDSLITEYSPRTLRHDLETHGRLPAAQVLEIGLALSEALGHLHRNGLVHRDVKPSNVIFVNGRPKLADIGLVTDATDQCSIVGTEGYLPPEGPGTPQADIFALGKVIYEAATGLDRREFPKLPPELHAWPDVTQVFELNEIILKACEGETRNRYQGCEAMQVDLLLLKTGKSVRQTRWVERRLKIMTRIAIATAITVVLGVAPCTWALLEARRARQELWASYLAQAQARRLSSQPGHRAEALKALKAAAEIRPSIELRNEAVACLALLDLRVMKVWPASGLDGAGIWYFDASYERYVRLPTNGPPSIRRVEDDSELTTLAGYTLPVPPCYPVFEFSPDGRYLAAVSGKTMRLVDIWDLNGGGRVAHFEGNPCRTMAFSPDSRRTALAFGIKNAACAWVEIYDLAERRTICKFDDGAGIPASCMRFHPTKNLLATSNNDSTDVRVWDLASGFMVHRFPHPNSVWQIDWNANGDLLAAACTDNNVYLWDPEKSESPKRVLAGHEGGVVEVSFSYDGAFLASRGWDSTLRIWNPDTGQQLFKESSPGVMARMSRPRYSLAHAEANGGGVISEITPSRECRLLMPRASNRNRAQTCDFSRDGRWLLTAHEDGVRIWDVASGKVISFLSEEGTSAAVFGPGPDDCLVASGSGIKQWTITRDVQGVPAAFAAPKLISKAATGELLLSHDGSTLAYPLAANIHILTITNSQERTLPRSDDFWTFQTMSDQGRLALGSSVPFGCIGPIRIFDLATTNLLRELPLNGAGRAAFSPDGKWFLVGDHREYRLWDTRTWQTAYVLPQVAKGVGFLGFMAFSPDSTVIALVVNRDTVHLIETRSGRELVTLEAPEAHDIWRLKFSPDGARLAVLYSFGPIQVWDLRLIRKELAAMNLDWEQPNYPLRQASAR